MTEYKIAICGGGGVGKSAITIMFIQGDFEEEYDPTVEDSYKKQIVVDREQCFLDILDTAGQEEYSAMRAQYMRTCKAFLMVFSVANRASFDELGVFHTQIVRSKDNKFVPIVIAANKCDLPESQWEVDKSEFEKYAESINVPVLETSAKENMNVEECFMQLVRMCMNPPDNAPAGGAGSGGKKAAGAKKGGKKSKDVEMSLIGGDDGGKKSGGGGGGGRGGGGGGGGGGTEVTPVILGAAGAVLFLALLALIFGILSVVLGGGDAAGPLPANSVTSDAFQDEGVASEAIAPGAITEGMVADGAVTTASIADGTVESEHVMDGNVTADKYAAGAVTTAKLADGAVSAANLGTGSVEARAFAAVDVGIDSMAPSAMRAGARGLKSVQLNTLPFPVSDMKRCFTDAHSVLRCLHADGAGWTMHRCGDQLCAGGTPASTPVPCVPASATVHDVAWLPGLVRGNDAELVVLFETASEDLRYCVCDDWDCTGGAAHTVPLPTTFALQTEDFPDRTTAGCTDRDTTTIQRRAVLHQSRIAPHGSIYNFTVAIIGDRTEDVNRLTKVNNSGVCEDATASLPTEYFTYVNVFDCDLDGTCTLTHDEKAVADRVFAQEVTSTSNSFRAEVVEMGTDRLVVRNHRVTFDGAIYSFGSVSCPVFDIPAGASSVNVTVFGLSDAAFTDDSVSFLATVEYLNSTVPGSKTFAYRKNSASCVVYDASVGVGARPHGNIAHSFITKTDTELMFVQNGGDYAVVREFPGMKAGLVDGDIEVVSYGRILVRGSGGANEALYVACADFACSL